MAKTQKRKKKNFRLRRSVRRTLGALFLMTAIIVAAIPFPDAAATDGTGQTQADGGQGNENTTTLEAPTYATKDLDIGSNGINLIDAGEGKNKAYTLLSIGGNWYYERQFDFKVKKDTKEAYITDYNKAYKTKDITLNETINTGYDYKTEAEIDAYINSAPTITINKDNCENEDYKYYFSTVCSNVATKIKENDGYSETADPKTLKPSLKYEYYCNYGLDGGKLEGMGYTMESVLADTSITGATTGTTDNYEVVFIPREKSTNLGESITGYSKDKNGFLYKATEAFMLKGIWDNAFNGVTNVDTIAISGQIEFIGNSAFENSFVKQVSIENVHTIGNKAFKGCRVLTSFTAKNPLEKIGSEAFNKTQLSNFTFPYTVRIIGDGAFANNDKLSTIAFEEGSGVAINNFAFYNCPSLSSQDLSKADIIKIGDGAFALSGLDSGTCVNFIFPETTLDTLDNFGNGILSGRTELKTVTMPASLGMLPTENKKLPVNTFKGCTNLAVVKFPDSCKYLSFDAEIFSGVSNPDFYVTGPAFTAPNTDDPAYPRKSTWYTQMSNEQPVPYVYVGADGREYFELSNGEYLLLIDDTGTLISCSFLDTDNDGQPNAEDLKELIIPDKVGNKVINGLATGCFGDKEDADSVLNRIIKLTVADGGNIKEIGDGVFESAGKLEEVKIGDSVEKIGARAYANNSSLKKVIIGKNVSSIGDGAFENCIYLADIQFTRPDSLDKLKREGIGQNALSTGSNYLVVTGAIGESYGPYVWAMEPTNYVKEADGIRVCYKTGDPENLTVILDNRNNLPTLMDYPKFEDLKNRMIKTDAGEVSLLDKYKNNNDLTPSEENIINSTLFIDIPAGIKSIDTKGYLTNTSKQTVGADTGKVVTNTMNKSIYFTDNNQYGMEYPYGTTYEQYGLFNGAIQDPSITEVETRGDDNILGVTMYTVEYLPSLNNMELSALGEEDYTGGAFYSCENLQRVDLGSAMQDVGSLPFLDCLSLNEVDASKTATYKSDNKILYNTITEAEGEEGTEPVSGLEIVEVLHTRGSAGDADVNTTADALLSDVVQIAPGAFMNTNVGTVDLTGTPDSLRIIPEDCFKDNEGLVETVLPPNIRIIKDGAFENTAENTTVVIKGKEVDIKNEAFKNNKAIVRTYKDTAAYNAALGIPGVTVKPLDDMFRVVFYNSVTGEVIKTEYVEEGDRAQEPEGDEIPVNPGMVFDKWSTDEYRNVTQDLVVLALYKSDGTGTGGTGGTNKPGEGNDGVKVPGGTDINGDGIPDYDENGNRLYTLTVSNGTGGGRYPAGKKVSIQAGAAPDGAGFTHWSSTNAEVIFNDATKSSTTLTMPAADTTVVSNFAGYYRLDVVYGSGSGSYPAGAKVEIKAVDAPQGRSFASWKSSTSGLTIENSRKQTTTVTMPKSNATVTATYMDNGSLSGNSTNKNSQNGTRVQITKPGIPNTDKASAYVSGSSDSFIVKISESAEATDAVQKALQAKYPDMTRVKYFAMDISLYDATGTRKITDTTGLKINITIPIPEALKEYAGNNKIAAVVNGQIEDLAPKFVTIDGVPCISFTATHFSPYTVYVDTANLTVTNTLDSTPKTGDGIHPKWFLSIGLACISMILFLKKDKKYTTRLS